MTITTYKNYTFKTIQPIISNYYYTFIYNQQGQLVYTTRPLHTNSGVLPRKWVDLQK
jgi:hypothetical protein